MQMNTAVSALALLRELVPDYTPMTSGTSSEPPIELLIAPEPAHI